MLKICKQWSQVEPGRAPNFMYILAPMRDFMTYFMINWSEFLITPLKFLWPFNVTFRGFMGIVPVSKGHGASEILFVFEEHGQATMKITDLYSNLGLITC